MMVLFISLTNVGAVLRLTLLLFCATLGHVACHVESSRAFVHTRARGLIVFPVM